MHESPENPPGPSANYRQWLLGEWEERKRKNPGFSLRAFAGRLGVSPASLSQILSGKRRLTPEMADRVATRLGLPPDERTALAAACADPSPEARPEPAHLTLQVETFKAISDWYHYAILSLTEVEGTRASPEWIAERLGILRREAQEGVDRLKRLGILEEKRGRYRQAAPPLASGDNLSDPAIRKHVLQHLRKAEEALDRHPPERLDYATLTMAIDPKNLPRASSSLKRFRRNLCKDLEDGKKREVYALSIQLYPLEKELP
jgi:uncharacterized protein (TIGR02147 family)